MKRLTLAAGIFGVLILAGCGQDKMSPKEEQNLNNIMTKGLGAPGGKAGVGQAKVGKAPAPPPGQGG